MAERVGFEPTCPIRDKTLSRRPRYDHFGTSPSAKTLWTRTFKYTVSGTWLKRRAPMRPRARASAHALRAAPRVNAGRERIPASAHGTPLRGLLTPPRTGDCVRPA